MYGNCKLNIDLTYFCLKFEIENNLEKFRGRNFFEA